MCNTGGSLNTEEGTISRDMLWKVLDYKTNITNMISPKIIATVAVNNCTTIKAHPKHSIILQSTNSE